MDMPGKRPLPKRQYISLTEALTFAVFNDCMTDREWREAEQDARSENERRWGTLQDLEPVLEFAQMWASGEPITMPADQSDKDIVERQHAGLRRVIERAEEYGGDIDAYVAELRNYLTACHENDRRWNEFNSALENTCLAGKAEISGKPCENNTENRVTGERKIVPQNYLIDGVRVVCGEDRLDPASPITKIDKELFDLVMTDNEYRYSFRSPRISQPHFKIVHRRFLNTVGETVEPDASDGDQKRQLPYQSGEAQVAQGKAFSKRNLRRWYEKHVSEWPKDKPPPNRDEDWKLAKKELGWVPKQAVVELRRELAPDAWKAKGRRAKK